MIYRPIRGLKIYPWSVESKQLHVELVMNAVCFYKAEPIDSAEGFIAGHNKQEIVGGEIIENTSLRDQTKTCLSFPKTIN